MTNFYFAYLIGRGDGGGSVEYKNFPAKFYEDRSAGPGRRGRNNGFLPSEILTAFDYSKVSSLENGQTLQEFEEEMVGMVAWQSHSAWENHQPRLDRNAYATAASA